MKVKIAIDTKTFVRFWLVLLGFGALILAIYNARTALILIGIAAFLALALNLPVSYIAAKLPGKSRVGATALAYIVVLLLLAAVVFLVIPPIADQTTRLLTSTPDIVNNLSHQWAAFGDFAHRYNLEGQVEQAVAAAKQNLEGVALEFGRNLLGGIGSVFATLFSTVLVLTLTFFMLVEGPEWLRRLWAVYRDKDTMETHRRITTKMYNVINGYVTGQLTVSAIGAGFAGLTVFVLSLFIAEVPSNLAFPTIAIVFTLSLIPMFGATIAGVIVSLLLLANNPLAAIIFAIYFVVYQQIENNFISPAIQSKRLELSPLIVLVAVTIGTYVFGLAGGIISIPIAGCIKVLLDDYLENNQKRRAAEEKPLAKLVKKIKNSVAEA